MMLTAASATFAASVTALQALEAPLLDVRVMLATVSV